MARLATLSLTLMLAFSAVTAQAAEVAALIGSWQAESFNGEAPGPGISLVLTFVDEDTLTITFSFNGEEDVQESGYEATENGSITFKPEGEPESTGNWSIDAIGKLHLVMTEEGERMELILRKTG